MKKNVLLLLIAISSLFANAQCWQEIVAGSNNHNLGIQNNGTLWAWGRNNNGCLGDGTTITPTIPIQIGTATNWTKIEAGSDSSVAIKSDGTLWAWGQNGSGQIGDGTTIEKLIPTQVGIASDWVSCTAGSNHMLAIKTNGTLWSWGRGNEGQLGNGAFTGSTVPIQIGTDTNWAKVDAGSGFTIAVKTNGSLWSWGKNDLGELGNGTNTNLNVPSQIGVATNWLNVACSSTGHTLALKTDGTLWSWGVNNYGQLGINSTSNSNIPNQVGTATNWKSIAANFRQSMALQTNGTLWTWGWNVYGQLGNGTAGFTNMLLLPTQIGIATDWNKISFGDSYGIALKTGGTRWTWGDNAVNQFGNGNSTRSNIPLAVGSCEPSGASLNFDGSNDYVTLPRFDFSGNNKVTIEAWIKPTNITTKIFYEIARQQNPPAAPDFLVSFQANGTILSFGLNTTTGYTELDVPITASQWTDGNWHHVAVVYDGVVKRVYKDGVQIGFENKTGNIISNAASVNYIGFSPESLVEAFHGNMDEVRYWNRALCLGEILNNKDCQLNPTGQANLFAYYQFNQGEAGLSNAGVTALTDISGNSRNGTLTNFGLTTGATSNWVTPGGVSSTVTCSAFVLPAAPTATTPQGFPNTATIVNLTTTTGVNIQWYAAASGGTALATATALVNGTTYHVSQTVNGCESARTAVVAQTNLTVADNQFSSKLSVYPNPSNGVFNIEIEDNGSIQVYDLVGKQIMNKNIQSGNSTINLSSFSQGIYFLKITNDLNQTKTVKIIKE